jgi:hypothetical protein
VNLESVTGTLKSGSIRAIHSFSLAAALGSSAFKLIFVEGKEPFAELTG